MKYFYKYLKVINRNEYGFTAEYNDGVNRFTVCDSFGYPLQANTKEEATRKAKMILDDLNGRRATK